MIQISLASTLTFLWFGRRVTRTTTHYWTLDSRLVGVW